jgi:hypothetical protein
MKQNERIELIKAAAILVNAFLQDAQPVSNITKRDIIDNFDYFYDYLQLKLEMVNDGN